MKNSVLPIGESAISYLCDKVRQDPCHDDASPAEQDLLKEYVKIFNELKLTQEQKKIFEDEAFCLFGNYYNLGYEQGFTDAFKLGIRTGAECFT